MAMAHPAGPGAVGVLAGTGTHHAPNTHLPPPQTFSHLPSPAPPRSSGSARHQAPRRRRRPRSHAPSRCPPVFRRPSRRRACGGATTWWTLATLTARGFRGDGLALLGPGPQLGHGRVVRGGCGWALDSRSAPANCHPALLVSCHPSPPPTASPPPPLRRSPGTAGWTVADSNITCPAPGQTVDVRLEPTDGSVLPPECTLNPPVLIGGWTWVQGLGT
jgi:hypothetical protein